MNTSLETLESRHLLVFDAIYQTGSVTAAAEQLKLGQPAVSIALAKLRAQFNDPLFVRAAGRMAPTPFAEGLASSVRNALEAWQSVLGHQQKFDPASSTRTFKISMTDISQFVLLPPLWARLRQIAPKVRIEITPLAADIAQQLEVGAVDLAMGYIPQLEAGFYQQQLFLQDFVCMVGAHHPRIKQRLSLKQFEAEDHAVISTSGSAPLLVEQEIARQGIQRRIALEIPNFLGVAFIVDHTDLLVTIPERLGEILRGRGDFKILPVPFPLPSYAVKQHWHERYHNDLGNRWLRGLIAELLVKH